MEPFTRLTSLAVPLLRDNVDTDAIIPSREITRVSKIGLAAGLFASWRYTTLSGREANPAFILNDPRFAGAAILLGGANFGCGSSREHAAWALSEYGFRAIVASSFNPIFRGNCVRNGILPVKLDPAPLALLDAQPLTIDLAEQTVSTATGICFEFAIDDEAKAMLIGGLDPIALTLQRMSTIERFRAKDREIRPWAYIG